MFGVRVQSTRHGSTQAFNSMKLLHKRQKLNAVVSHGMILGAFSLSTPFSGKTICPYNISSQPGIYISYRKHRKTTVWSNDNTSKSICQLHFYLKMIIKCKTWGQNEITKASAASLRMRPRQRCLF